MSIKVAYWPGCVSRGFTPELHGSMAAVAPKLDIEMVELDRANCCGAGVIAEHNQELVDSLNARTFAMAQGVDGALGMMNICSTCQGAQSECQQRLDADTSYREHINTNIAPEGLSYRKDSDVVEQELPLAARGGDGARRAARARGAAARTACAWPPSTAATSCAPSRASGTTSTPSATPTSRWSSRRSAPRRWTTPASTSAAASR